MIVMRIVSRMLLVVAGSEPRARPRRRGGWGGAAARRRDREHRCAPGRRPSGTRRVSIPHAVHIYIVNDPTLNSFVAGGQNLFMNTGTHPAQREPEPAHRHHGARDRPHRRRPSRALRRGDAQRHDREHHRAWSSAARPRSRAGNGAPAAAGILGGASVARALLPGLLGHAGGLGRPGRRSPSSTAPTNRRAACCSSSRSWSRRSCSPREHQDPYLRTHPLTSATHRLRPRARRDLALFRCQGPAGMDRDASTRIKAKLIGFLRAAGADAGRAQARRQFDCDALRADDRRLPHPRPRQGACRHRRR